MGLVGAAGGDEHDALVGDPTQGCLGARHVAPVPPGGEGDDVLVHGRGEGGGAAVVRQLPLDGGDVADGPTASSQLGRHADGEEPGVPEGTETLGHEGAVAVVDPGEGGDLGAHRRGGVGEGAGAFDVDDAHGWTVRRQGAPA